MSAVRPAFHPAYAGASPAGGACPPRQAPAFARLGQDWATGTGPSTAPGVSLIPQTRWPAQPARAPAPATCPAPAKVPAALSAKPGPNTTRPPSAPRDPHGDTAQARARSFHIEPARPLAAHPRARAAALLARLARPVQWPSSLRVLVPRALALIAACLLAYAVLSPTITLTLPADAATTSPDGLTVEPMPFEQPGASFPGSAFYYLAPEPARDTASLAPDAHWDGAISADPLGVGPSARPVAQIANPIDRVRALTCLTTAIYYEAATEPDAGQKAVAQVILNRMAHPAFPKTVCGVVFQGSERATGCQFTFTCDGSMVRRPMAMFWNRAEMVARAALAGYVYTPVGLATHYHTFPVHPYWDDGVNFIGQIGAHRFYRMQGPAGAPETFSATYRGGEPVPGPHPRSLLITAHADVATDPLVLQRAFAAGKIAATPAPSPAIFSTRAPGALPPPAYTSEVLRHGGDAAYRANNLPGSHADGQAVNPDYQNSGRWLGEPQ